MPGPRGLTAPSHLLRVGGRGSGVGVASPHDCTHARPEPAAKANSTPCARRRRAPRKQTAIAVDSLQRQACGSAAANFVFDESAACAPVDVPPALRRDVLACTTLTTPHRIRLRQCGPLTGSDTWAFTPHAGAVAAARVRRAEQCGRILRSVPGSGADGEKTSGSRTRRFRRRCRGNFGASPRARSRFSARGTISGQCCPGTVAVIGLPRANRCFL